MRTQTADSGKKSTVTVNTVNTVNTVTVYRDDDLEIERFDLIDDPVDDLNDEDYNPEGDKNLKNGALKEDSDDEPIDEIYEAVRQLSDDFTKKYCDLKEEISTKDGLLKDLKGDDIRRIFKNGRAKLKRKTAKQ